MVAAITLNPTHAKVGTTGVLISGTGFTPNATPVAFTFGGAGITPTDDPITVAGDGTFSAHITIPASIKGNHTINANDGTVNANATFATDQNMVIDPAEGPAGELVQLTGSGFGGTKAVTLQLDGVAIDPVTAITTNSSGGFTGTLIIPRMTSVGAHTILATDADGNTFSVTFTVDSNGDIKVVKLNPERPFNLSAGIFEEILPIGGAATYSVVGIFPFFDFTDLLLHLFNSDESNTITFTISGHADYNDGISPDPTLESWFPLTGYVDIDIAPDTSKIVTQTRPNLWSWIMIQAKPKVANSDATLEMYARMAK